MSVLFERIVRSTRMALFQTEYVGFEYVTHGGTILVVSIEDKPYGITARHIAQDFHWQHLCVMDRTQGTMIAGLKSIAYANNLAKSAAGTDLGDIAIIEFSDETRTVFLW